MYEWIGIIASSIIIIAFLVKNELSIRIIDLLGAIVFIMYGILIKSFSVALLNSVLVIIQILHIRRLYYERRKDD